MPVLKVNGSQHNSDLPGDTPLLWGLCDELGLLGTRCGCCTVHAKGKALRSSVATLAEVTRAEIARAGRPADDARLVEYEAGPLCGFREPDPEGIRTDCPRGRRPGAAVAGAIVSVVDRPFGERRFRVHIDPSEDGAAVALAAIDRCATRCCAVSDSPTC